ncbi:MAG: outer membrane protein assembly factor BamD [Puniceicoccales bacterium]|jgi:tetratricopeptide (TPR) repeat protein|nr:outer membrane protein assembly factor BamD [Puniceicoccales bacterium]
MKTRPTHNISPALSLGFLAAAAMGLPGTPANLHAAPQAPATPAAEAKDRQKLPPFITEFQNAETLFQNGKYLEAIVSYNKQFTQFKKDVDAFVAREKDKGTAYNAFLHLRLAASWQALKVKEGEEAKKWKEAEKELLLFLQYPKGTDGYFGEGNFVRDAQIALAQVYGEQQKWEDALKYLAPLLAASKNSHNTSDRVRLSIAYCKALVGKARANNETAAKTTMEECLATIITPIIATRNFRVAEIREAANYAVELFTKLGKTKEARALSDSIQDATTGNPLDRATASFQRFGIAEDLFRQADELQGNPDAESQRMRLYRQALGAFQEILRSAPLTALLDDAMQIQEARVTAIRKKIGTKDPTDEQKAEITKEEQARDLFAAAVSMFRKNPDYDAFLSYRIALCLLEINRPWEAFIALRDIFENSPKFSRMSVAHYYYIKALRAIKRTKEAQEECRKFIAKYPAAEEIGEVAVLIGEISFDLGDYKEAVTQFRWARANVKSLTKAYKEWVDWYICAALFQSVEWEEAQKEIESFLSHYPASTQREQMVYMRGLCYFFLGKYQETLAGFGVSDKNGYLQQYPKGKFVPEAEYRLALVEFGVKASEREKYDFKKRHKREPAAWEITNNTKVEKQARDWLEKYDLKRLPANVDAEYRASIEKLTPEVRTLLGDVYFRYLDDKTAANTNEQKTRHLRTAINCYVEAALGSSEDSQTFDFVTRELNRRLPAQQEWGRMLEIYHTFYSRNPNSPKALGHLYWVLRSVERLGKTPEARRGKLAAEGIKGIPDEYLVKPAVEILADAIKRNIGDYRQENVEQLIGELANRIVAKTRREVQQAAREAQRAQEEARRQSPGENTGATPAPAAAPAPVPEISREERDRRKAEENRKVLTLATEQIATLLRQNGTTKNIVPARVYYACAQVAQLLRNHQAYNEYIARIVAAYKEEELSPAILAAGADYLLEQKNLTRADSYAQYILDHWRSSDYADVGFLTKAEILLEAGTSLAKSNPAGAGAKYAEALAFLREAVDNDILLSKEKEIRLAHARALILAGGMAPDGKTRNYDVAAKILADGASNKAWRGEYTAWCLYYLGQVEEKKNNENAAINYYRRCFLSWKKHAVVTAKAYLRVIELFRKKGDTAGVGGTIHDMLQENNPASRQPEAAHARALQPQYPYRPPTQPTVTPQPAAAPSPK